MRYKNEVILAGFLHDIGKFYQKSGSKTGSIDGIKLSGGHQQISVNFFNRYIDIFKPFVDTDITREMIQRHHEGKYVKDEPDLDVQYAPIKYRAYCKIVAIADNISSSERAEKADKKGSLGFEHASLHSVFTRADSSKVGMYKFGVWNSQNIIPEPSNFDELYKNMDSKDKDNYRKETYRNNIIHIRQFSDSIKLLEGVKFNSFDDLMLKLQTIFRDYLWCCISESQGKIRDISLYDHLLTTSAIAISMYNQLYSEFGDGFKESNVQKIMDNIVKKHTSILNTIHIRINGIDRLFDKVNELTEYKKDTVSFINYINSLKLFTDELLRNTIKISLETSGINNCIIKYGYDWYIIASDCEIETLDNRLKEANKEIFNRSGSNLYLSYGVRKLYDKVIVEDICSKTDINLLIELMTSNGSWDIDKLTGINDKLSLSNSNMSSELFDSSEYNNVKFIKIKCNSIKDVLKKKFKTDDTDYNSISRISTYMRFVDGFFDMYITERCKNSINISFGLGTSYIICKPDRTINNLIIMHNGFNRISLSTLALRAVVVKVANKAKVPQIYNYILKAEYELTNNKAKISYCGHILQLWSDISTINSIITTIKKVRGTGEVSEGFIRDLLEYSNMYNEYLETNDPRHLLLYALYTNKINKDRAVSKEFKDTCNNWILGCDLSVVNNNLRLLRLGIKEATEQERKVKNG